MALAAASGQVDLIITPSIDTISTYESSSAVTVHTKDGLGNTLVSFNCQKAPFDDVNVRRAVASAIDAASICSSQMGDYASVGTALPFSETVYGLDEAAWQKAGETLNSYSYNMDQASSIWPSRRIPTASPAPS
jgi:peptide/nickel transport system substrate-binding protein